MYACEQKEKLNMSPNAHGPAGAAKYMAAVGVASIIAALIAGCAGSSSPGSSGNASSAGTLVLDNQFNNSGLDPDQQASVTANTIFRATYDTLLTFSGNSYTPVPDAATSYTASANAKTYTFTLRSMKFADGSPVTAQDVVFSFDRLQNLNGPEAFLIAGITAAAPNSHTVVLTSATPNPAIPRIVTTPELSILNAKLVEAHGGTDAPDASKADKAQSWLNYHSAGSGPYVLKSAVANTEYILTANPEYWGLKPKFGTVVIRDMTAPTQFLNIQRDSDEIAYDISATQAATLESNSRLQVVRRASTNIFYLGLQVDAAKSPVTANKDIWNAIKYGLNYTSLTALGGQGAVQMSGIIPRGLLGSLPASDIVQRNIAKAKAYVAASKIANPTFNLAYIPDFSIFGVSLQQVAEIDQASLAQVGINVKLQALPINSLLALVSQGKAEATVDLSAIDYPDPNDFLLDAPGGVSAQDYGYTKQAFGQAATLARQAGDLVADSARSAAFQQLQLNMNEYSPWIPQFQPESILVASSNLTGVASNDIWGVTLADVGTK
jgi:peptide/nickel transport system substrate-binding protein